MSRMRTLCTRAIQNCFPVVVLPVLLVAFLMPGCAGNNEVAVIETSMGNMVMEFHPDVAPNHVARFKELAREGFYDGILWHRVIPGFVIQAGDPLTKDPTTQRQFYGQQGSGTTIAAEFSEMSHVRGVVGMAREADSSSEDSLFYDTADSQFYIVLSDRPHLDGKYTVFGTIIQGMEIADSISVVERDFHDVPLEPVRIESIRIVSRGQANLD